MGVKDHNDMDVREESSQSQSLPCSAYKNLSSPSSAFFSANQSPFFSPRSPTFQLSTCSGNAFDATNKQLDSLNANSRIPCAKSLDDTRFTLSLTNPVTSAGHANHFQYRAKYKNNERSYENSSISTSFPSGRIRSCDVYIGLHVRKPLSLRFTYWLRAELESQGLSCFITDRSRCRNSRKHGLVERAMDTCTFGVVILTRKSFRNPYTIQELCFFSSKKNLVPIYFDLGPDDCLVRDIIEKRGELWEKHGGELWLLYGGLEQEWRDAVNALLLVDEWKLDARDGKWRNCISRVVTLLALRLGRRSVVDRITKLREKMEKEEFPFPRNVNFVGRKKELSELEFMLFGDVSGDAERDYFELKTQSRQKNLSWGSHCLIDDKRKKRQADSSKRKGKEPVVWKESEKEIEMQSTELMQAHHHHQSPKLRTVGKHGRRRRSVNVVYGKGIACVSGDSGIGKTELLLEFAYRYHQRYKMVLWVGGESRYIRQNYLKLWSFLDIDVGVEDCLERSRIKSFEEQEEAAIARVRKELMRNIPFLLIIDNLENERDWWDCKLVMDLLPRFGGETHVIVSTCLSRVMNLEPLRLSCLSGSEAMSLMQGSVKDYPTAEINALQVIEERLGRLTLGLTVVGAILSELPINPSRLLDTISQMPLKNSTCSGRESHSLWQSNFLLQLFEVCFSIFDHADGPRSLATGMVLASGWFAPTAIPVSLLASAAHKIPERHQHKQIWKNILHSLMCGFKSSHARKSETEASSMLLRFNMARSCTQEGCIQFNHLIKLYARKRGIPGVARAMVGAVISRGSITQHLEHIWAACFLLFGFGNDPVAVELKAADLLYLIKEVIIPIAIQTFMAFSRCSTALELLRLCTNALEAADQVFVAPVDKCLDKSLCWKPIQTTAQLNPYIWKELALSRANVLEIRAKLMLRGAQFDIADDLIRKAVFIRTSICGEDHPDTISAKETLNKLTRLFANGQIHMSP